MAASSFTIVMPHIFEDEGGYVDHPSDPGGATNMGITIGTLRAWRGRDVTKADVKALTRSEAMAIYDQNYWDAIRGDDLPAGVDYAVLDYAINSGPGRAAKLLQKLVGANQDGEIGPITLGKVKDVPPRELVDRYCDARMTFLQGLDGWPTFGRGWKRRVDGVRALALELAVADTPKPEPFGFDVRLQKVEADIIALKSHLGITT